MASAYGRRAATRLPAFTAGIAAVAGYGALQWLGRTYGSTRAERRSTLPGDELCPEPHFQTTHATTIDTPPERVWPWLVQMGWGRGQWYTARWVDRLLFPANGPSAEMIVPELQQLAVGDRILDGPPEAKCAFVVAGLEANRHLVLHSCEHLPPGWADRYGAWIDFTWVFVLDDLGDGRTRLVFRSRSLLGPPWVRAVYLGAIVPADFVMSRQMLRGVKRRAERSTRLHGALDPVAATRAITINAPPVTRVRAVYDWRRPAAAFVAVVLMEFGDFAMQRRMLRGINARAESLAAGVPR